MPYIVNPGGTVHSVTDEAYAEKLGKQDELGREWRKPTSKEIAAAQARGDVDGIEGGGSADAEPQHGQGDA